jgi:hypothetical protein
MVKLPLSGISSREAYQADRAPPAAWRTSETTSQLMKMRGMYFGGIREFSAPKVMTIRASEK